MIPVSTKAKGLIFDLDGTIIDSMPLHHRAYNHALIPYGISYPMDIFLSRGGIPTRDTMKMIEEENNIAHFDINEALERKRKYLETNMGELTLIQPVFDIIKSYHGRLPMSVGTGSNRKTVNEMFELFSLGNYIDHVVTASEVIQFKPHPETFLKCAELMQIAPEDCIVFEDGKPGIMAAKAAKMQVIDVLAYI